MLGALTLRVFGALKPGETDETYFTCQASAVLGALTLRVFGALKPGETDETYFTCQAPAELLGALTLRVFGALETGETCETYSARHGGLDALTVCVCGALQAGETGETDSTCQASADRLPLARTKRRPSTMRPAFRPIHLPSRPRLISPRTSAMSWSTSRNSTCLSWNVEPV